MKQVEKLIYVNEGLSCPDQAVITNIKEHDRGKVEVLVNDQSCMYILIMVILTLNVSIA